jgi:hypothetical protein
MEVDDIAAMAIKSICSECVGESYLSNEIYAKGTPAVCSYCTRTGQCYSIGALADRVETAFEHHYTRTSDQPDGWQQSMLSDRESTYEWERDGVPVVEAIEEAVRIPSEAASDVQIELDDRFSDFESAAMGEETEFGSETYYSVKDPDAASWHVEWQRFEESLKTEARFFSRAALAHLASVFGGIDTLRASNGRSLVVNAGPEAELDHLYRARIFQSDEKLEEALCRPDLHLGSPPSRLASAGRMNARGIAVFYGSTVARTAIAEVRPPVGCKVAVAKFNIIRPLRLLDLTALEHLWDSGSMFDSTLKGRLERVAFLRSLGQRMARPVMPDDEAFDYLATQAIADFLATENDPLFDGIIFRSAQVKDGRNVVLFHKAARVEELALPTGTKLTADIYHDTDEGREVDYWVNESVPSSASSKAEGKLGRSTATSRLTPADDFRSDGRNQTLRIDTNAVNVHWVDWVSHRCTTHEVKRHRFEMRDPQF